MAALTWNTTGTRKYETGIDKGVLYIPNSDGEYVNGYAWNGLTAFTESPTGGEANPFYADNVKYLNLVSREELEGSLEAFMYPDEFGQCDGSAQAEAGVWVGQQERRTFGFCYRTLIGNDVEGDAFGYKIHLVWGALATPSEKAHNTVNDTPEPANMSWDITTTPIPIEGNNPNTGKPWKPTATMTIVSTDVNQDALADLEDLLYGTISTNPSLPLPAEVIALFASEGLTSATPTVPTFNDEDNEITIPSVTGVIYKILGVTRTGVVTITTNTLVTAHPAPGYKFPAVIDTDWLYTYSA